MKSSGPKVLILTSLTGGGHLSLALALQDALGQDYETDIERRWWLSGKLETDNLPLGSKRACRGVLSNDFDDLQGDPSAMYTAVIFNPVPGPPMGKNPRLSFRYKLKGTDTLRVQIYSLTRGYHRYLSLTRLPQDRWESATVDMTGFLSSFTLRATRAKRKRRRW